MDNYCIKDYHIFTNKNEFYLFVVNTLSVFKINQEIKNDIENLSKRNYLDLRSLDHELIEVLQRLGLIQNLDNEVRGHIIDQYPIKSITLMVAQLCNLNCIYC